MSILIFNDGNAFNQGTPLPGPKVCAPFNSTSNIYAVFGAPPLVNMNGDMTSENSIPGSIDRGYMIGATTAVGDPANIVYPWDQNAIEFTISLTAQIGFTETTFWALLRLAAITDSPATQYSIFYDETTSEIGFNAAGTMTMYPITIDFSQNFIVAAWSDGLGNTTGRFINGATDITDVKSWSRSNVFQFGQVEGDGDFDYSVTSSTAKGKYSLTYPAGTKDLCGVVL